MRKVNQKNVLTFLIFMNVIFLVALLVVLFFFLPLRNANQEIPESEEEKTPEIASQLHIDEEALLNQAANFNVSIEYLQMVLPGYLVFRNDSRYEFQPLNPSIPQHEYDWENLYYANNRTYYLDSRYPEVCYGIDVSVYQGDIDWEAVAADGIDFAFIRVGYRGYTSGALMLDTNCLTNVKNAMNAGLDVGVYFFSQATSTTEAVEEAELLLSAIEGYDITYPVVFDMEEIYNESSRVDNLSAEDITKITRAFCKRIAQAGLQPMIYGNTKWLASHMQLEKLMDYPIWFAQYNDKPLFLYDFFIWQYSSTGTVEGIEGSVDLNICFKSWQSENEKSVEGNHESD